MLPDLGLAHEPIVLPAPSEAEKARWDAGFHAYIKGQVEELLTRYGKIDLLWFDGGPAAITMERIHEMQPGIVVNGRAHGQGDFETPEGVFPKERPAGWWEQCHCWVEGGWAYRSHEIYKPTGWAIAELARVRAWGGNFLPSFGPDAHGELPTAAYRRLDELAAWWQHSGESVEGTTGGPWPERCNVPVTCRDDVWYLHVSWVWDGPVEVKETTRQPKQLRLLRTGEPVEWMARPDGFSFELQPSRISAAGEVVKLEWA